MRECRCQAKAKAGAPVKSRTSGDARDCEYDPGMNELRTLGPVVVLALLLTIAGCGSSDDDPSPDPEYGTSLTIARDLDRLYHGTVRSKLNGCSVGRRVVLFEQRRGRDRELGVTRSGVAPSVIDAVGLFPEKDWAIYPDKAITLHRGARLYAEAPREERSGYACRADRSKVLRHRITND